MFEPKTILTGFPWVPPDKRPSRFGGPLPPRKPELRTPALWLARRGSELFLVNSTGTRLDEVQAAPTGFVTLDEDISAWESEVIHYRDVPDGAGVKVDEYDDFYDLDYVLGVHLRIRSPQYAALELLCHGGKGGCSEEVLLWTNGDVGKGVAVLSPLNQA